MRLVPPLVAALWLLAAPLHAQDEPEGPPDEETPPADAEDAGDAGDAGGAGGAGGAGDEEEAEASPAEEAPAEETGPSPEDVARRRAAHQAAIEVAEPRPPLRDVVLPEAPEWERHIEVGADFAFVIRPFAAAEIDNGVGYDPAPAWGLHLRWRIASFLRFHAYFVDAHHNLQIPQGALVAKTARSISPDATIDEASVTTFVFGARLAPTWEITDRLRAWIGAGVGWGRFEFPVMVVRERNDVTYQVRARDGVFVEFPISIGASFDIIERWLAIELEATGAPITGQSGDAHATVQAVDADGNLVDVGGFGAIQASFVNTIGLSLIL